ncbi:hypothetical protein J4446_00370 [Candidatus Woesearchaeota archaeon]|nr:hypothetical protein [Candidatus Woesearchaeota archaeon]
MKNKGVVVFLVIALLIVLPIVSADTFLSGYSIFDKVGDFFGNTINFFKGLFNPEKVAKGPEISATPEEPTGISGEELDDSIGTGNEAPPERLCNEGEKKCEDSSTIITCQNNQWVETEICSDNFQCLNGECISVITSESQAMPTQIQNNYAPTITLLSPENGATNVQTSVTLTWNGEDADNSPSQIITLRSTVLINEEEECVNTFGESCTLNLEEGTTYYWSVSVTDGEHTTKSNTKAFSTISGEICNDGVDNDGDQLIDCADIEDCEGEQFNGYKCNNGIKKETACEGGLDEDSDGLIDNLDIDCSNGNNGIVLGILEISGNEYYQHTKIPAVNCHYTINPSINGGYVKSCLNLTMDGTDMQCEDRISEEGFIKFRNCGVGSIGEKQIMCSAIDKCNGYPSQTAPATINIAEFSICENGNVNPEMFNTLRIDSLADNEEFEAGGIIDIELSVEHSYVNEQGEHPDIDITAKAELVDTSTWETIVSSQTSEMQDMTYIGGPEIFYLSLTIPENLESNYRLYVKAYKSRDENGLCNSISKSINIRGIDEGTDCTDDDSDGYCEEDDCDDSDPTIFPGGIEFCSDGVDNDCDGLTDFADSGCTNAGDEDFYGSGSGTDETDTDGDGIPDSWEYNWFGNLLQGPDDDIDGDGISNIDEYRQNSNPKLSDKKKSSLLLTILLVILGIVIVAGVALFVISKLKKPKISNYNLDQTNMNKLKQFIEQSKAEGMKRQDIKNSLINAGWKKQDIDRFL